MDEESSVRFINTDLLNSDPQYEKLSETVRLITDRSGSIETWDNELVVQRKNGKTWEFLSKLLLFYSKKVDVIQEVPKGRTGNGGEDEPKKKRKSLSSWLPDPDQRWPVQGW